MYNRSQEKINPTLPNCIILYPAPILFLTNRSLIQKFFFTLSLTLLTLSHSYKQNTWKILRYLNYFTMVKTSRVSKLIKNIFCMAHILAKIDEDVHKISKIKAFDKNISNINWFFQLYTRCRQPSIKDFNFILRIT